MWVKEAVLSTASLTVAMYTYVHVWVKEAVLSTASLTVATYIQSIVGEVHTVSTVEYTYIHIIYDFLYMCVLLLIIFHLE